MKTIVAVNAAIPNTSINIDYLSRQTLRDYDIAVFNPEFPPLDRIEFSGGGSCLTIEATRNLKDAINHWRSEITVTLSSGKTIFILMNERQTDFFANGSTLKSKNQRIYNTSIISNYEAIPIKIELSNVFGKSILPASSLYRGLYDSIKDICSYRVIINSPVSTKICMTRDGATVGAIVRSADYSGSLVLLPYIDFDSDKFVDFDTNGRATWADTADQFSNAFISQLISIDKLSRNNTGQNPPPSWIGGVEQPKLLLDIDESMAKISENILALQNELLGKENQKAALHIYYSLLYENGKPLEVAIEKVLMMLGYSSETFRDGDLEIDHVIVGPSGVRMIGESEGKDNSAIDITKFRQLESNIGEDFQRDQVNDRAKGLLFGNGYRLIMPSERPEQFTQKCMKNAQRLGSALIRTFDLYPIAIYMIDYPNDEAFKQKCRQAIEETGGGIVKFPSIPQA